MHDVIGLRPQSGFCDPNTCGAAQYVDRSNRTCQNCDASCATCTGPTIGDCLTCSGGATLMNGMCCASNQFNNGAACSACTTCLTCDGPTDNDCLTCPAATHTKTGKFCSLNCTANEYNTGPGVNTCVPCNAWCSTCGGAGPNECNSCPLTYTMINASVLSLTGSMGYCIKQCLGTTEYWTGMATNTCATCPMWCNWCTGGTSSDCKSCNTGYTLESNPGFCRKDCLSDQYNDGNLTNACYNCHAQCLTCNGGAYTECLTCRSGRTLDGGLCGIDCPTGQYNTGPSTNTCAACHTDCQTCSGPNSNQCLSCPSAQFLAGGQCVANCPNGTWLNGINCDSCSPCT
jgi:proprotein convertase subtilisin/kexin type 5